MTVSSADSRAWFLPLLMTDVKIHGRSIGLKHPTYFVADIAANHDGSLDRAIRLIHLAAEAGADAVKFQHFRAPHIVSQEGFAALPQQSHQAGWKKSVFQVYKEASLPWEWTKMLQETCRKANVHCLSAPYDLEAVDYLEPYLDAYKIGSGDITWIAEAEAIARKRKPVLLATGAACMEDVERAVGAILAINSQLVLMQCNTNYTGSVENIRYVNLRVLETYAVRYPNLVLGLSDHTPGHATVLGAVMLGARVIEKHFTDDRTRQGPDHGFSLDPASWRDMVDRTRELEHALGDGIKRVEPNEEQTVVIQRRCLRAARNLPAGTVLDRSALEPLRPAPPDGVFPYQADQVLGRKLRRALSQGDYLRRTDYV